MSKDFYKILGVPRSASADEIRKAFRKLARTHHPDVNSGNKEAEEKFKTISEAYDVLSNPEKKKNYDAFGSADFQGFPGGGRSYTYSSGGPFGGAGGGFGGSVDFDDLGDIFGDLFRGGGRGVSGGPRQQRGRRQAPVRGKDLYYKIELDLLDAVSGCEKNIRIGSALTLKVKIPAGVDEGSKIRLAGKGEPGIYGGPAGDLLIETHILDHPYFQRRGDDIEVHIPITIVEAIEGGQIRVPTIDGFVDLKISAGAQSGQRLRLKNKGVPNLQTRVRGHQYVELNIFLPEKMDGQTKKQVASLFKTQKNPREGLW